MDFNSNAPSIESFLDKLPKEPTFPIYCVVAYDSIHWLAKLIAKHGTDNTSVKDAIYNMNYEGIFTTYKFDKSGDFPDSHWVPWRITADGYLRDEG